MKWRSGLGKLLDVAVIVCIAIMILDVVNLIYIDLTAIIIVIVIVIVWSVFNEING